MEKINLNLATTSQLMTLQGIGQSLAERIVAYRSSVGRFRTIAELAAVPGISTTLVESFQDEVTVQNLNNLDELPDFEGEFVSGR